MCEELDFLVMISSLHQANVLSNVSLQWFWPNKVPVYSGFSANFPFAILRIVPSPFKSSRSIQVPNGLPKLASA